MKNVLPYTIHKRSTRRLEMGIFRAILNDLRNVPPAIECTRKREIQRVITTKKHISGRVGNTMEGAEVHLATQTSINKAMQSMLVIPEPGKLAAA
ncbi:predicted protein [Lichtheimia corymbifera JMRC:FSU:9682]|uniref:Uncharacterized protein n=1 Tax=Lichtheimia corymbifera JMRC:FSU:9682 TaxID=1263082 RepID=A0A068RTU2_9FUNG|nr:predicted protein [Lichtheimia corymbifera JMRC:FSU:9682]